MQRSAELLTWADHLEYATKLEAEIIRQLMRPFDPRIKNNCMGSVNFIRTPCTAYHFSKGEPS